MPAENQEPNEVKRVWLLAQSGFLTLANHGINKIKNAARKALKSELIPESLDQQKITWLN